MSKVDIELDKDSEKILNSVSPVMRNAAVIIGLKLLSKSSMYKAYISDDVPADIIPGEVVPDDITEDVVDTTKLVSKSETVQPVPEAATKPKPSVSWESF